MKEDLKLTKLFNIGEIKGALASNKSYVGIDFGTSTTVVSIAHYNPQTNSLECRSLQLAQKDKYGAPMYGELFPTVIAINQLTTKPIYGQGAYDLKWDPDYTFGVNLWHSFKMELGKDLGPRWYESQQSKIKSPQDATKMFFKFLKKAIREAVKSENMPEDICYSVSIPASFESNQRKDLLEALAANDIIVDGSLFIDEPNAAFLGYINSMETSPIELNGEYNPKVLVFDFGAGTCDISLLEITADHQGMHSNNLSISQFAELGGNDIDRYIAHNYLLPQLLKANGFDGNNDIFTTKQKEVIVNQLLGTAEIMKKRLCTEDFNYLLSDPKVMDEFVATNRGISIDTPFLAIPTNNGTLTMEQLWLSYADFIQTMKVFFKKSIISSYTTKDNQRRYNSINEAIETALSKANVSKEQVDYVIMIGGSSRNPFVQQKIKHIFKDAKVMIPRDIQALVSQGAALHSILNNGIGIQAVRPIVGEPILVVIQTGIMPVINAGTDVPFSTTLKDAFTTGSKTYKEIEIPICVGNEKKLLYNLKLIRSDDQLFQKNTPVTLHFNMDSDKILHVRAETLGEIWEAICENPLDNSAMTPGEAKVMKAQRASYISATTNDNRPTAEALEALSRAYEDNNQEFMAAETLEELIQYYPKPSLYNRIGVLFHNSGVYNRAIAYFKKALKEDPNNPHVLNNLGHDLYVIGDYVNARSYLEKSIEIKGDYAIALTVLAHLEKEEGEMDKSKELYQRAFNIFNRRWMNKDLNNCEKDWFKSVANKLGKERIVKTLEEELCNNSSTLGYLVANTLFKAKNF